MVNQSGLLTDPSPGFWIVFGLHAKGFATTLHAKTQVRIRGPSDGPLLLGH